MLCLTYNVCLKATVHRGGGPRWEVPLITLCARIPTTNPTDEKRLLWCHRMLWTLQTMTAYQLAADETKINIDLCLSSDQFFFHCCFPFVPVQRPSNLKSGIFSFYLVLEMKQKPAPLNWYWYFISGNLQECRCQRLYCNRFCFRIESNFNMCGRRHHCLAFADSSSVNGTSYEAVFVCCCVLMQLSATLSCVNDFCSRLCFLLLLFFCKWLDLQRAAEVNNKDAFTAACARPCWTDLLLIQSSLPRSHPNPSVSGSTDSIKVRCETWVFVCKLNPIPFHVNPHGVSDHQRAEENACNAARIYKDSNAAYSRNCEKVQRKILSTMMWWRGVGISEVERFFFFFWSAWQLVFGSYPPKKQLF